MTTLTTGRPPFLGSLRRCCVNRLRVARESTLLFAIDRCFTNPEGGSLTAECGTLFHTRTHRRVPFLFRDTGHFFAREYIIGHTHACCCCCCERRRSDTHTVRTASNEYFGPHTNITTGFPCRTEWMDGELNGKRSWSTEKNGPNHDTG